MGNPNRVPDPDRHVETYEGRPIDPRFESRIDPYKDSRFDTHLNPAAVVPRRRGATLIVLSVTLGVVILALLTLWLFRGWGKLSPRSPEHPQTRLMLEPVRPIATGAVLPLAHYREQQIVHSTERLAAVRESGTVSLSTTQSVNVDHGSTSLAARTNDEGTADRVSTAHYRREARLLRPASETSAPHVR